VADFKNAIDCAKENAPYLAESLELFPDIESQLLSRAPARILEQIYQTIPGEISDLDTEMAILRRLKRKAHLVIAVSDIARHWDWEEVTEHLTRLADFSMARILAAAAMQQNIEGTRNNPVPGLFILAVGKYGARELNYSSDVDFNVFYDPEKIVVPNPARAERTLIKLIQSVVRGMEAITEDGYIFRTDLRLRPDPRSNAIAVSTQTAERYYETLGQNWERAAMIKARTCAGDMVAGRRFEEMVLHPFIWRKNMDYAAIEDILAIKRQIHARTGSKDDFDIAGHNIKLGFGGIREIEFYAQVQQLILGGRHPELRTPRTVNALQVLSDHNFISRGDANVMQACYDDLRTAEHALQMINDAQTHTVPEDETGQTRFAALLGSKNWATLSSKLAGTLATVRETYQALFPEAETLSSREGNMVFTGVEPDPDTLAALIKLGYQDGETVWLEMARWLGGRIAATRAEKSRELLTALAPKIIEFCADTGQADQAFATFRQFLIHQKSGVSLLSRFRQKPEHLKFVISLMVKSKLIADWITERPAILDALSSPDFLHVDDDNLLAGTALISETSDFEDALNQSRRWGRESRFRISTALLSGGIEPGQAGKLFSILAETIVSSLIPIAIKEAEKKCGKIEGEIAVLAMGKLASRAINLTSDLDLIVIYEAGKNEEAPQGKYAKVTQRLISALSSVTEEGGLYEVDMALRPSGRSGPVAVSTDAFVRYYIEKAWSWEFMALTRSRVIAATSQKFKDKVQNLRRNALKAKRPDLNMAKDIADMLRRTRAEKLAISRWDMKNVIGGIRDIEFIAQKLFLENRMTAKNDGVSIAENLQHVSQSLDGAQAAQLAQSYEHFLAVTQYKSILSEGSSNVLSPSFIDDLANLVDAESQSEFMNDLDKRQAYVEDIVQNYIFDKI